LPLSPGSHLAQYEIVAPLGAGGMGNVYRARDVRLGRDVALKVMADHIAADPEMRRRFEVEARAVAALSHPSIMAIHELAIISGVPVAVMELLEGETLRARISKGVCPWREAVRIAAAVAEGLSAAHARGVIHRDLKPENIFLTSDGAVKILDFGLALQRLDGPELSDDSPTIAHTAKGVVLGTFGYMSPEQVTGGRVDGRSDLFALGCVLYEMLAGRRLFDGRTPNEIIASLLHDSVPDLSTFEPAAPPELRGVVMRAIARDPARRFESAQDCAAALHALESGSGSGSTSVTRRTRIRGKSLAILPFINAGVDPKLEYLTDGITESIINSLSQLDGLRIVPRSLVFRYKGLQADPATVGLALNARTILTGRVAQQGDVLNIQAELVDASTESQLWGEQFRQRISDLITVQQEIAWQISEALRLKLTGAQKTRLRKRPTANAEASQEYLRGRFEWNSWTAEGFRRAVEHFEQAISLDPKYAPAYAGISDCFGAMAYYGFVPPAVGYPRARDAAEKALAIDPDLADSHASLALVSLLWQFDWQRAEREFQKALELNPNLATAHATYALYLMAVGRHEEALTQSRLAQQLDPLPLVINMTVCWALHFAGRAEEAGRETRRTRELASGLQDAGNLLMALYEHLDRFEDAARLTAEQPIYGVRMDPAVLLEAFHTGGPDAYWRRRIQYLDDNAVDAPPAIHYGYAVLYTRLREYGLAIDHLEKLVDARSSNAVFTCVDPGLRPLHGDPRFQRVISRLGVPTASAPHTA
jgi:serine/threonine protein kinase/Flp pilus assembly protein TadD